MRIAILSDVHADLPALEAVLADIAAAGVDARQALGDLVGYAPWPHEVLERLQAEGFHIVMGNCDLAGARFLNAGSAGKPKDGDPRGCWALDTGTGDVEFRRTPYDVGAAAMAIEASGLPDEFAAQLREARGYR